MNFSFVHANQADYPITVLCDVLEVSRSGYYAWLTREPSARKREDRELQKEIQEIHAESGRS